MAADPIVKESLLSGIAQALFQTGHRDQARKVVPSLTDDWLKDQVHSDFARQFAGTGRFAEDLKEVSVIKTESIRVEALESIAESRADSINDQDVMKWISQIQGVLAKAWALLGLTPEVY
ncbi:MAG: hypothetical protein AABZ34_04365 [Nitrospirota bacterium]